MRAWPEAWGYPHALLVGLVAILAVAVVFAGATSAASFGSYNPSWDGASQLRTIADDAGADVTVLTNASRYRTAEPDGTVAVILSPDRSYAPSQRAAITEFVQAGGTVLIAEDYGATGNQLLAATGSSIRIDGRPLRDEQTYYRSPGLPVAPDIAEHSLTSGVDQLTLNHGTTLVPASANASSMEATNTTVLANSSEFSYLDRNRNGSLDDSETMRARPVVAVERVGAGRVIVVSDPSVFINAMVERPGNRRFAANIFSGTERVMLDYSHASEQPPLAAALLALRASGTLTGLVGLIALTAVYLWIWAPPSFISSIRRRETKNTTTPNLSIDEATLTAYLGERHPDWDERRLRRVIAAVLRGESEEAEDE